MSQNCATLYLMISSKDLFEMLLDDGAQWVDKSNFSQLFKTNSLLGQMNLPSGANEPKFTHF